MRCILQLMSALCALYVMLAGVPSVSVADDWPQWLGPERGTVWRETGILETFPEGGPPLRWSQPLGGGDSGAGGGRWAGVRDGSAGRKKLTWPGRRS
ncbi:MAG: hypothetical protein Ct9H300mP1_33210 [Planctomycetaceae bacterium]|nr:MAG: hypothetical protein Ct9H300mP1_33210 [Planctomycetaceae bacterium]